MAEKDSKEIEQNNREETNESESKTEESGASQDDAAEAKSSNVKSPAKPKTPAKETKEKKGSKKKEESEDESDDEELIGILDAPLVVEGKRIRKSTEFLSNSIHTPQSVEKKRTDIPEGKGETLGSMPRVQFQLTKVVADELKPLHRILFGRPGHTSEVKRNIRLFRGFNIEKGSKEYKKKEEQVDRFTLESLRRLCEILDVEKKGKKEEMLERVMDFLLLPKASGKSLPEEKKKSSASKKSSTKRKRPANEKKSSSKKKSDETVDSDEDSEEEEKEEEKKDKEVEKKEKEVEKKEKEPPAKKAKVAKKESKKPAKKEKKVVIKISPGKKTKKAKEKKAGSESDSDEEPLSKKAKKSPPTNDEIVELVKELLDGADLEKITMKSVCKQVYERFPDFDLTDRKEFIKDAVKEIIT